MDIDSDDLHFEDLDISDSPREASTVPAEDRLPPQQQCAVQKHLDALQQVLQQHDNKLTNDCYLHALSALCSSASFLPDVSTAPASQTPQGKDATKAFAFLGLFDTCSGRAKEAGYNFCGDAAASVKLVQGRDHFIVRYYSSDPCKLPNASCKGRMYRLARAVLAVGPERPMGYECEGTRLVPRAGRHSSIKQLAATVGNKCWVDTGRVIYVYTPGFDKKARGSNEAAAAPEGSLQFTQTQVLAAAEPEAPAAEAAATMSASSGNAAAVPQAHDAAGSSSSSAAAGSAPPEADDAVAAARGNKRRGADPQTLQGPPSVVQHPPVGIAPPAGVAGMHGPAALPPPVPGPASLPQQVQLPPTQPSPVVQQQDVTNPAKVAALDVVVRAMVVEGRLVERNELQRLEDFWSEGQGLVHPKHQTSLLHVLAMCAEVSKTVACLKPCSTLGTIEASDGAVAMCGQNVLSLLDVAHEASPQQLDAFRRRVNNNGSSALTMAAYFGNTTFLAAWIKDAPWEELTHMTNGNRTAYHLASTRASKEENSRPRYRLFLETLLKRLEQLCPTAQLLTTLDTSHPLVDVVMHPAVDDLGIYDRTLLDEVCKELFGFTPRSAPSLAA